MKRLCALGMASCLFLLSGCVTRLVDYTAISTKNMGIDISSDAQRGTAKDCRTKILIFPSGKPSIKEAVDRVLEQAGPEYDALVDGVVTSTLSGYVLFSKACFEVEGTPIITDKAFTTSYLGRGDVYLHSSRSLKG